MDTQKRLQELRESFKKEKTKKVEELPNIIHRIETNYKNYKSIHEKKEQKDKNRKSVDKAIDWWKVKPSDHGVISKKRTQHLQDAYFIRDMLLDKVPEVKNAEEKPISAETNTPRANTPRANTSRANNIHVTDLLSRKTTDDLVMKWEDEAMNYEVRDKLLEEMTQKGVRPEKWIADRNIAAGLYPDIDDPDFAAKLSRKTEFASLRSEAIDEDTCSRSKTTFEKTAVQRLIARFLHPATPYNGVLLHHGVGVGKTCSAITVAETFLEILPMNTVYIIVPQAIADGFRRTIFDVSRLKPTSAEELRLTGEQWTSPQCTGSTYLHLTGTAASKNLEEIADAVDQEVKRRYKIMGYLAFANFVEAKKKEVPSALTGQERIDAENEKLMSIFSDHLLIIDEAHNLRDSEEDGDAEETDKAKASDAKEGKKLTPLLKQILRVSEGLRLMLMTATPMYNTAPEIVFLLNLLYLNDTKDDNRLLKTKEIFKETDFSFVEGGEAKLEKLIRRYVSFMRGEHPNTFPLRLTPANAIPADFEYPTISMKISEGTISMDSESLDRKIMYNLPLIVHTVDASSTIGSFVSDALRNHIERGDPEGGREITNLDSFIQMGNLVYPDGTFGKTGFSNYFEEKKVNKLIQYSWKKKTPTIDNVFGSGLRNHSPKMASIVESITRAKGMSFVFSRYKKAGALPLAIALEMAGWCRVLANGTLAPLLKREFAKPPTMFYVLLTSDEMISPDFKGLLQYATTLKTDAERNGSKVKAILGSQIASEGLDLKCIRELHLLEGWFHLNRIEQIEGRGVRFCSHADLHVSERNCLIYLHALHVAKYETPDLYMYRIATRKAQPIGRVSRLMKINAWDCMLNRDAILLADLPKRDIVDAQGRPLNGYDLKDKEYSSFCDFSEKCTFECSSKQKHMKPDISTYKKEDFRKNLLFVQERIAYRFSDETALPIADVREIYKLNGIPWSIAEIGLRELLGKMKIKREDGIIGTLVYLNDYIVFQPDKVTDLQIPLALRYGRAYGLIPRELADTRPILSLATKDDLTQTMEDTNKNGKKGKKLKQPMSVKPGEPTANNNLVTNYDDSMAMFMNWKTTVEDILSKPTGPIVTPGEMKDETFRGWRWAFYMFRSLPEIRAIAYRWWMDNFWSWQERRNVMLEWIAKGITEYMYLFKPIELFESAKLSGFVTCNSSNKIQVFCKTSADSTPKLCPSILLSDVEKIIGAPVDRKKEISSVYGFAMYDNNVLKVKTVLKKGTGLQCVGTSNLTQFHDRMKEINTYLENHIGDLLLQSTENVTMDATQKEQKTYFEERYKKNIAVNDRKEPKTIYDLSLKQICPYMEILLRYADMKRIDGKRWFLSAVDTARMKSGKI